LRGAHAKSYGFVKAAVEFLRDVPAAYAQGIYSKPGRHEALIRFSSANGHMGPDAQLGGALGFAIKIFDIEGTSLLEDEPDSHTFDLVLKNNPIFLANRARHYLFIEEIVDNGPSYLARGEAGFHELLTDFLSRRRRPIRY
jgi:catalase